MGQKIASLEIELAMATGGAVADLNRFGGAVDKVSAQAIRDLDKIDASINGIGDMSGPTAAMVKFADATAKSAISAARELARVERAGESMAARLDRQLSTFGKTASEVRSLRAETAALAADQAGASELATRIRAKEQELYDAEFAAMRRARAEQQALAEDRAVAAASAAQAAEREATATREAAQAHQMFEAAVRQGAAALREQEAADKAGAIETHAVAVRNAAVAHQMFEMRVREGANAMRAEETAAASDAAALQRLREMLDPAAAARVRLNREVEEARRVMLAAGAGAEEMARAEALLIQRHTGVIGTTGNMKSGMQQLSFQLNDMATMWSLQAKPMQIFASQAGQVIQAIQIMAGESKGLLGILGGPWGQAFTIAAIVLVPLIGKLWDSSEASNAAEDAFDHFVKHQADISNFIDKATGKLIEQNRVLIQNAILTRQASIDTNAATIRSTGKSAFSSATTAAAGGRLAQLAGLLTDVGGVGAVEKDPAILGVIRAAGGDVAKLDLGLQALARRRPELKGTILEISNAAGQTITLTRENQKLKDEIDALSGRTVGQTKVTADLIRKQVELATAQSPLEQARARYNLVAERGAAAEKLGAKALENYRVELTAASQAVNAAETADKAARTAATTGRREQNKELRDGIRLANEAAKAAEEEAARQTKYAAQRILDREDLMLRLNQPLKVNTDAMQSGIKLPELPDYARQMADELAFSEDAVKSYAAAFGDAFGGIGDAVRRATAALVDHAAEQRRIQAELKAGTITQLEVNKRAAIGEIGTYADITGAAKSMFSERSKIYKGLQAAETVFRAVQLAMSIQKMIQDTAETVSTVANSGVRAVAQATEGVATQSKLPFPLNIAAMAATAAALAGIGVAILGSVGGGKNNLPKANEGAGTVLGDPMAKSESIQRSLDALGEINDATLGVSRNMLNSLRAIEDSIGGLSSLLVRAGNINASGGVSEGFKTNAVGSILSSIPVIGGILGGLFGTKTTVVGSGLYGGAQSLADILGGGFDASYYSDVQKKKKLFGLTTSTKYRTEYTGADAGIEDQFTLLLRQFYDTIGEAAGPLGQSLDAVQNRLLGFTVDIGKIDLQGLTGDEIQEKLSAVFGAAADSMAEAAVPGLSRFQKVGEGAFETLVRVSSTVEQVDAVFRRLGVTTGSLGIDVDMAVAGIFDSVSDFTGAADAYFEAYYSDAERAAAQTAQMGRAFIGLGLAMPDTLAGFRQLVDAQDLTTAAGQQMYATLLQIAPAFAELKGALDGAASAAAIVRQREDLERKLLELSGNTAAIRAAELAKLDPSNRALQKQIYAIQDAQEAAKAAEQLRDAWKSVGDTIMDEVRRIRGLTDAGGGGSFATLMGQFNAATAAAGAGDIDATKSLPQLSKALLDAAAREATSRQELDRVRTQTAAVLEAIAGMAEKQAEFATPESVAKLAAASAAASNDNDSDTEVASLRQEMATMRTDLVAALATIASNTGALKRTMDSVTSASGGDAISVANA